MYFLTPTLFLALYLSRWRGLFAFGCVNQGVCHVGIVPEDSRICFQAGAVGCLSFFGFIVTTGYQERSADQNSWDNCSQVFWVNDSGHKLVLNGFKF